MTLETLLNKLIELWRKPRGLKLTKIEIDEEWPIFYWMDEDWNWWYCPNDNSINDLCSLESGLWQFVVKKRLYNKNTIQEMLWAVWKEFYYQEDFRYRLMLSSIQPDKEKFLLDNISLWQH